MNLDYLLYRLKYRYGRYLDLKTPVDVSLELSSICNMFCTYCYHADKNRVPFTKGIMKLDIATEIIKQASKLYVPSIKFNWKGEPTLNPEFENISKLALGYSSSDTFIERIINSNFKFDSKNESIFNGLSYMTKVKVSYDSFDKNVFETQRAGGDHDLTSHNIDLFHNHWLRGGTSLVIQAIRTSLNKTEDLRTKIKSRWPKADISIRDVVEGRRSKEYSQLANKHRDFENRQSCLQAHARVIFNHDGKAFPCCPDIKEELCLGDIKSNTLFDIFNSAIAKQLRLDLRSKSAFSRTPCLSCSSFESYKGYKAPFHS